MGSPNSRGDTQTVGLCAFCSSSSCFEFSSKFPVRPLLSRYNLFFSFSLLSSLFFKCFILPFYFLPSNMAEMDFITSAGD